MTSDLLYTGISLLGGISCRERIILFDSLGSGKELFALSKSGVEHIVGRRLKGAVIPQEWERRASAILQLKCEGGFRIVRYWDRDYPPQLREIHDPPFLLYVRGELPDAGTPSVAVVGTRRPTEKALQASFLLGAELSLSGIPVVSGLAKGVDAAAHWGAVKTGGSTAAVEATGIDRVYPSAHRELAGKIIENGGCLISEYPPGTEVRRYRFPERNRIISGVVRSVVVVQAPSKSGALITADYAIEEGRDLMVHKSGLTGTAGSGGQKLAEEGARVIESIRDITDEWKGEQGVNRRPEGSQKNAPSGPALRPLDPSFETLHDSSLDVLEEELEGRIIRYYGKKYRRVG
ncbi:MAG: DNA-processing protein DprA [Spirochaetaceae bacterium]